MTNKTVYITCMGRSGSTLLRQMLNRHPDVIAPPESFFVLHLMDAYKNVNQWTPKVIDRFIKDLYTERSLRLIWNISKKDLRNALLKEGPELTFVEVSNIVRSCYAPSKDRANKVYVDKNPVYSVFYERLIRANPKAKVIHLIRDPRGVINGQINTFKRKDVFALGHMWTTRNEMIENVNEKYDIDAIQVRFEDIVENPQVTIKSICDFIGIEYSDSILNSSGKFDTFYSKQSKHFSNKHKSTQKPLSKKISEKWRKSLSENQLEKIRYTTHNLAIKYGYSVKEGKGKWNFPFMLSISKLKLVALVSTISIYFRLPLFMRKSFLYFRSKMYDHRYIKSD